MSKTGIGCRILVSTLIVMASAGLRAQTATPEQKIDQLSKSITEVQGQVDAYQKQLLEMQQQLNELKQKLLNGSEKNTSSSITPTIEERVETVESQVATHDALKVESASKYPVVITGQLLFNTFINTHRVDVPATPTYALRGGGSTGFTMRQTLLGLDARGPHVFGASSRADIRVDFFGSATASDYSAGGLIRLRTAHASLNWKNTEAFASYDRTILSPDTPTSLASVAVPALSWSGNLWVWNPQVGITHAIPMSSDLRLTLQAAFIDVADPLLPSATTTSSVSIAQRSRWPGVQTRVAVSSSDKEQSAQFGIGGYFSPHRANDGSRFNAWAATADLRLPLGRYLQLTSNVYRGQALGGLGAGGYADFIYRNRNGVGQLQAIDDVGGWVQMKLKTGRFNTNFAYGLDNPFSKQINARVTTAAVPAYQGLTRNSTLLINSIFSPNVYIQFSLEYKHLHSTYPGGDRYPSDAIGVAGAYRF